MILISAMTFIVFLLPISQVRVLTEQHVEEMKVYRDQVKAELSAEIRREITKEKVCADPKSQTPNLSFNFK